MHEAITQRPQYKEIYLPWVKLLLEEGIVVSLIEQPKIDRNSLVASSHFFVPPLNRLEGGITLSSTKRMPEEEVTLVAEFEENRLRTFTFESMKNYFVAIEPATSEFPIRYGDNHSHKLDRIVKHDYIRDVARQLVLRTAKEMQVHINHRVPIAVVPETAFDWAIEDGNLPDSTINALIANGISTYGDLGILSVHQIKKIPRLGARGLEAIKTEFANRGWLSSPFRSR
jgi:hypothetical protein